MTDKLVTHEDLPAITALEREWSAAGFEGTAAELLARLREAAEADQPPLPEDWVLHFDGGHWHPYWHEQGHLYRCKDVDGGTRLVVRVGEGRYTRDRLTPLRPTVTAADVEKAAIAYMSSGEDTEWDGDESEGVKSHARFAVRTVLVAAGIEVQS